MFKLNKVSNQRVKAEESAQIIATPTKGNVKVTGVGAKHIGLSNKDRVAVAQAPNADKVETIYVYVTPNASGDGNIASFISSKKVGALQFSSAAVWNLLKGNTENNVAYDLGEPRYITVDEAGNATDVDAETEGAMVLYPLSEGVSTPKQERDYSKSKAKKAEVDADEVVAETTAEQVAAPVTETGEGDEF